MEVIALICGSPEVRHWYLTPRERLARTLNEHGVRVHEGDLDDCPPARELIVVRGDRLYDDRIIKALVDRPHVQVLSPRGDDRIVAIHAGREDALEAARAFAEGAEAPPIRGVASISARDLVKTKRPLLRKARDPFVLVVDPDEAERHEKLLYDASYKGVTDLVTKWLWPTPAYHAVRLLARLGIHPNHVTATGFLLMLVALWAFWRGAYGLGLLCAWIMTFFDTVDGKLARTTVTSSRFGHFLDKVTDIVHPPFWYIAWGLGLDAWDTPTPWLDLDAALWLLVAAYVAGRLVEAVATRLLISGGLFVWRPFDSHFRLITARRNICLIPLTLGWLLGRSDLGLWAVVFWTVATTVVLLARMMMAIMEKPRGALLDSWLAEPEANASEDSLALRWYTERPV